MKPRDLNIIKEAIFHINDSPHPHHNIDTIDGEGWHKDRFNTTASKAPKGKYQYCGYHFLIKFDGEVEAGRLLEYYGQHCKGHNYRSVGICFQGDISTEITDEQLLSARELLIELREGKLKNLSKATQHSDYEPKKPHCAGLTKSQLQLLNQVLL